jgi:SAM-dependent methyltransferase
MLSASNAYCCWKSWQPEDFSICSKEEELYFDCEINRLRAIGLRSSGPLVVLELGFGNGTFAGYSIKRGWRWIGIEENSALVNRARECGLSAHSTETNPSSICDAGSLDLVVAFDVLEHLDLHNIQKVLTFALELLRPGGFVLARVPSGDSPFGRALAHGDITHKTTLGSSAVLQLSDMLGFTAAVIDSPCVPLRGVGIRRWVRRLGVVLARRVVAATINIVFHDNAPKVISPNMIFALRKPETDISKRDVR